MKKIALMLLFILTLSLATFSASGSATTKQNSAVITIGYQGINNATLNETRQNYGKVKNVFYSPYYLLIQNISGYISDIVYVLDKNGKYVAFYHIQNGTTVSRQILVGTQMIKVNGVTYKFTAAQNGIMITDPTNNVSYLVKTGGAQ